VSAPGRGRKGKVGKSSLNRVRNGTPGRVGGDDVGDLLFDGDSRKEEEGGVEDLEEEGEEEEEEEEMTLVAESRSRSRA